MSLEVKLDRADRTYFPGETVTGNVVVRTQSSMKHQGIKMLVEGNVNLLLSARSIGLFEAFYSSMKPVQLLKYEIDVTPSGKCPSGITEYPFQFSLSPLDKESPLEETYHGVYVNIKYDITCDMPRGMMAKALQCSLEIVVHSKASDDLKKSLKDRKPFHFKVSPDSLQNVKESSKRKIPNFAFDGFLDYTVHDINTPFSGEFVVRQCEAEIKSIELQLVRVETCTYMEGEAREATEIQNIQIADGDVVRNLAIPIYFVFPRLYACATTQAKMFKVEFEVNLIILFSDNLMVTENFPITLYRL